MQEYKIMAVRYGFSTIEAENWREAIKKANETKEMDDFDWDDDWEAVDVIEED